MAKCKSAEKDLVCGEEYHNHGLVSKYIFYNVEHFREAAVHDAQQSNECAFEESLDFFTSSHLAQSQEDVRREERSDFSVHLRARNCNVIK